MLKFNALDKKHFSGGAVKQGEVVKVMVESSLSALSLSLESDKDGKVTVYPMQKEHGCFTVSLLNLGVGLYFYHFVSGDKLFGRNDYLDIKEYKSHKTLKKYQLTVYKKSYQTPDWLKGGVIYQIFPDRFNKGGGVSFKRQKMKEWGTLPDYKPNSLGKITNDDFYGGNFNGITKKLPYLKSLGVTAIYLNPISKAFSNHRYDTGNYLQLDELLGTEKQFKTLVTTAEKLGISIIFDGVYNHTGDDSLYFNKYNSYPSVGAYNSKNSPYYDWFTFQEYPNEYTSWWGINVLPTINKNSIEFEDFITNKVIPYYFSLGVKGVRLDVVDELPSRFTKKIRKAVKKANPNAVVIGEVWEDATNKIAYDTRREYFQGEELDSVMNYPLKNALINFALSGSVCEIKKVLCEQLNNYPQIALNLLMNVLSTHDTPRILTVLSGEKLPETREGQANFTLTSNQRELAVSRLKAVAVLLFTLYGSPTIYYGDERGFEGGKDPFNRQCMRFTGGNLSIFNHYKKLAEIRNSVSALKFGDFTLDYAKNGTLVFTRTYKAQKVNVAVNMGNTVFKINSTTPKTNLLTNETSLSFELNKYSYLILGDTNAY